MYNTDYCLKMANTTRSQKYAGRHPITGAGSKRVKSIIEKLDIDPMEITNDIEFKTYVDEINARSKLLDVKRHIQKLLSEKIVEEGFAPLSYKADIVATEDNILQQEKDAMFHRVELEKAKKKYKETPSQELLDIIAFHEQALLKYNEQKLKWFDYRNKARNSLARQQKKDNKDNMELLNDDIQDAVWEILE